MTRITQLLCTSLTGLQITSSKLHTSRKDRGIRANLCARADAFLNDAIRAANANGHDAEGLRNMAKLIASKEIFKVCMHR